jgi:putative transposase
MLHIVFSTKDRQPLIHPDIEEELYGYIIGTCKKINCPIIKINGVADHIHILLHLRRTISISDLLSNIKANSSRWIKTKGKLYKDFSLQNGYGGFAVSRLAVESAIKYISKQKEHHKKISFKEELLAMLERAQIPYNKEYLWD